VEFFLSTVEDAAEELAHAVDLINMDAAPGWFLKGLNDKLVFLDGNRNSFIKISEEFITLVNKLRTSQGI